MYTTRINNGHGDVGRFPVAQGLLRTALFLGVAAFGTALTSGGLHAEANGSSESSSVTTPAVAESESVLDGVRADRGLSAFLALVEAAELTELLEGNSQLTLFAPNNSAFAGSRLQGKRLNTETVRKLVLRHVVRGRYELSDLAQRNTVNSIAEDRSSTALSVARVGDRIVIGGEAWIVGETIQTANGVIHVISRVLEG
jgi:uncharacterized surface protein with fasciclin (FAS1) repeats